MGCTASVRDVSSNSKDPISIKVDETWDRVWKTCEVKRGQKGKTKNLVVKRTGWKTIRIFVSSTFKDFHQERETLVKKGIPKDCKMEEVLQGCLQEIDRCYQENIMPFFVNMTSERIGWVPQIDEIPDNMKEEYKWIDGLSVTEMEIMHAAYRNDNPNALFLLRDPTFLSEVPDDYKKLFIDSDPVAPVKLNTLKKMVTERFHKDRVVSYKCSFAGYNKDKEMVQLDGLDKTFSKTVFEFFKSRISKQYPLTNEKLSMSEQCRDKHEAFMKSKSECVLGRDNIIKKVDNYIDGVGQDVPLLVLGGAGCGKSSVMAKIVDNTLHRAQHHKIRGGGTKGWHVFYHFVGAVPGSTELDKLLRRFLTDMQTLSKGNSEVPTDLDNAAQMTCGILSNPNTPYVILIIDALNQLDDDLAAQLMSWVPRKLAPNVRCVFSMIPDTPQHKALVNREPMPKIIQVNPLDIESRKTIAEAMLGKYNKRLDEEQMDSLLSKNSSSNPLWLFIACEELRVFGQFRKLSDKINTLADGLLELEQQVIARFEDESGGKLLMATLCLLECSATGLLETELLEILGDEDNLIPEDKGKDKGAGKDDSSREKSRKDIGSLPFYKWAEVYRALRLFLRPFGDSGEGRLDFYHRSLSKAVRIRYFRNNGAVREDVLKFWHKKLADFFEFQTILERQLEEYPYHLVKISDHVRLKEFLTRWTVVDELYHEEFSSKLCYYWRQVGFEEMDAAYITALENLTNSMCSKDELGRRYEQIARILAQCGRYELAKTQVLPKALKIEEEELGKRPERMAELYHLTANTLDEILKLEDFIYHEQLPQLKAVIENLEKSAELRRTLPGKVQKVRLGRVLNKLALYYNGWALRGGDENLSMEQARELATKSIDEAIDIFTQLEDDENLGDAYSHKGIAYGYCCPEQIKAYEKALEILLRTVGEVHHTLYLLYLNIAIYYEDTKDWNTAYLWFRKWHTLCCDLYGPEHPRTKRPTTALQEPTYRRIAQERGDKVPGIDQPHTGTENNQDEQSNAV